MAEYIEREAAIEAVKHAWAKGLEPSQYLEIIPAADVAPVRHGRWILQANNERTNYRWNVTAECSECCDEVKEIWAGFFHNVPDWLARDVALESAKSVKLSNYCPNCGARCDGGINCMEGSHDHQTLLKSNDFCSRGERSDRND